MGVIRSSSVADEAFESVTKGVMSALDVNQGVLMGLVMLYFLCTPYSYFVSFKADLLFYILASLTR